MNKMPPRQSRGSSTGTRRGYPRRGRNPNHAPIVGSASSPGNVKFEHIPSISRSSGVDPGGDTYVYVVRFSELFLMFG
jgi:hypothetical protein